MTRLGTSGPLLALAGLGVVAVAVGRSRARGGPPAAGPLLRDLPPAGPPPASWPLPAAIPDVLTTRVGQYRHNGLAVPENPYYRPAGAVDAGPVRLDVPDVMPGITSGGEPVPWRSRAELPDDALAFRNDRYTTATVYLPGPGGLPGASVDQYGRGVSGETPSPLAALKAGAEGVKGVVKGVTSSPLWTITATAFSFVPGIGTAVSVGMAAAYAYGHDLSLRDAALGAARAAVPGGAAGQAAFDVGVALASGESATQAAIDAARNQVPAGPARQAFDAGIEVSRGRPVTAAAEDHAAQAARDYLSGH